MPDMSIAPESAPAQTPMQQPMATPSAYGADAFAAVGQAADQAWHGAEQAREINLRNQYETDLGAAQVRLAQVRDQMGDAERQIQTDSGLSLAQYHDTVLGQFDQLAPQVSAGVTNSKIQNMLSSQIGEMRADVSARASAWQTVRTAGAAVGNLKVLRGTLAGQAYKAEDPAQVQQIQLQWADAVHALPGLTPDQREAVGGQGIADIALQFGYGLAHSDPAKARALFDQDWFEAHGVSGDNLHILERTIDVQQGRADAEAKAQQHVAAQAVVLGAQGQLRTIQDGGSLPLPQILSTEQQVRSLGPEHAALADELHVAAVKSNVNTRYGALQPQAVTQLAQGEAAKVAALEKAGKPVPLDMGAKSKALTELAANISQRAASDPWELAAARGIVPTPIDWNDTHAAQALGQRIGQAQVLARSLGPGYRPMPLQKPEADQLRQIFASGNGVDQVRVMSTIAAQEAHMPGSTAAIFNQVSAPPEFRVGTALMTGANPQGPQVAADMVNGYHALQKLPGLVEPKRFEKEAGAYIQTAFGGNLNALAGDPRHIGVMATARALYTSAAQQKGLGQQSAIDPGLVKQSVNRALGAYTDAQGQQRGGLGQFNGQVILPDGASQKDFTTRAVQQLPGALAAAGVHLPTYGGRSIGTPEDAQVGLGAKPTLSTIRASNPQKPGESTWAYNQRLGNLQWSGNTQRNFANAPGLPANTQLHAVDDGKYKFWTGSGYLTDAKGRQAVWDYRTGKVGF